jgi:hypothetical protein
MMGFKWTELPEKTQEYLSEGLLLVPKLFHQFRMPRVFREIRIIEFQWKDSNEHLLRFNDFNFAKLEDEFVAFLLYDLGVSGVRWDDFSLTTQHSLLRKLEIVDFKNHYGRNLSRVVFG